jgi:hypothetical protein
MSHDSRVRRYDCVAVTAVVTVFALLAAAVSMRTPAWEAADEPHHVQNVETLASGH